MKGLFVSVLTIISSLSIANAAPVTEPDTGLTKRAPMGAYWCTGVNWSGNCFHTFDESCHNFDQTVRSFGPDQATVGECYLYSQFDCETVVDTSLLSLRHPGHGDLPSQLSFNPASYRCFAAVP